ncbi:MAG: tetratricopeptide repeat protein, partial [Clostridiales Family XIII bacterium]|nr:tetratricopeptide repeat protein [Clostridiales Family XIII bacterium]
MNNSEFWRILKIEPTKDEASIRLAYRSELPNYHPEDDPEGFRALREAYEAAIAYANESDDPDAEEEDNSDSGLILQTLRAILKDFIRRIDTAPWLAVLESPACNGIDIQSQVSEKLLIELMKDYYLPQKIWKLLDNFFGWSSQIDLLNERFPENYIEYVVAGIRFEQKIRAEFFDLSDPSADFEGFINQYYELSNAIDRNDNETADRLVSENTGALFQHLDYQILLVRYYHHKEEGEQAEALARTLISAHPDDMQTMVAFAYVLLQREKYAEALSVFEAVLVLMPDHYNARVGAARCYFELEDYEEAKARCLEMCIEYYFDSYVQSMFH